MGWQFQKQSSKQLVGKCDVGSECYQSMGWANKPPGRCKALWRTDLRFVGRGQTVPEQSMPEGCSKAWGHKRTNPCRGERWQLNSLSFPSASWPFFSSCLPNNSLHRSHEATDLKIFHQVHATWICHNTPLQQHHPWASRRARWLPATIGRGRQHRQRRIICHEQSL